MAFGSIVASRHSNCSNTTFPTSGDRLNNFVELKAKYGKGRSATFSVDSSTSPNGQDLTFKANAPQMEQVKKLELTVHSKVSIIFLILKLLKNTVEISSWT